MTLPRKEPGVLLLGHSIQSKYILKHEEEKDQWVNKINIKV
jgi:hypothetical protein